MLPATVPSRAIVCSRSVPNISVCFVLRLDEAVGVEEERDRRRASSIRASVYPWPAYSAIGMPVEPSGAMLAGCAQHELRIVAGVDVAEQSAVGLQDAEEEREVDAAWRVLIELAVETIGQRREIGLMRQVARAASPGCWPSTAPR